MNIETSKNKRYDDGFDIYRKYVLIRNNKHIVYYGIFGFKFAVEIKNFSLNLAIYYCDKFSIFFGILDKIISLAFAFLYASNGKKPGLLLYNVNREFCVDKIVTNTLKIVGLKNINLYISHVLSNCIINILYDILFFHLDNFIFITFFNVYLINPNIILHNADCIMINRIFNNISQKKIKINFYILNFSDLGNKQNFKFLEKIGNVELYNFYFDINSYNIINNTIFFMRINYLNSFIFGNLIDNLKYLKLLNITKEKVLDETTYLNCSYIYNFNGNYIIIFINNVIIPFVYLHDYFLLYFGICNFNIYELKNRSFIFYFFISLIFIFFILFIFCIIFDYFLFNFLLYNYFKSLNLLLFKLLSNLIL